MTKTRESNASGTQVGERHPGSRLAQGAVCPAPAGQHLEIQLGHGSGGKMSARLLQDHFLPRFSNRHLAPLGDGAVVSFPGTRMVLSTDSFVVQPLEFPGGDIGHLAVNGTVNDLAMMGARPLYLTAGFILEEGLPLAVLDRILDSMAQAAEDAHVEVVTGDTKVVERGSADGLFINTTGVGVISQGFAPQPDAARPGDAVLVSGPLGRHGMAVMAVRNGLAFEADILSDTANLSPLVEALREGVGEGVHVLRDATRGGVASALNEIAASAGVGVDLYEGSIPVPGPVGAACEMLGLDPLYVANEGVLVAMVAPEAAERALEIMRSLPVGRGAARIGTVVAEHGRLVILHTGIGGTRVVDMLPGDQLPRIC